MFTRLWSYLGDLVGSAMGRATRKEPDRGAAVFSRPECPFRYCDTAAPHEPCRVSCRYVAQVVVLVVAAALSACTTSQVLENGGAFTGAAARAFCRENPKHQACVDTRPTPPSPSSSPTSAPPASPSPVVTTPTATPTTAPTSSPAPLPTSTPVPPCIPAGDAPVTLAYRGGCPRWAERLHFEGEGAVVPPAGLSSLCGVRDVCRGDRPRPDGCTAFLLGLGMGRQGMTLVEVDGVWLQYQCSGRCGFTDARGMFYPDGRTVYDSGGHPDGWRAPYTVGGYESPTPDRFCGSTPLPAPPPDIPTPTAPTPSPSCDVVERVNHWMAPGNKAHGHHPEGDLLRAVIDSTIRSDAGICDTDHAEDWKRCGFRHHDADFRKRRYAFSWKFVGIVEDLGPNTDDDDDTCSTRDGKYPLDSPKCTSSWENSAQRVILAERGACVTVTVCIPDDARTPDGCRITAQGGGCGTRTFRFPEGGDCQ